MDERLCNMLGVVRVVWHRLGVVWYMLRIGRVVRHVGSCKTCLGLSRPVTHTEIVCIFMSRVLDFREYQTLSQVLLDLHKSFTDWIYISCVTHVGQVLEGVWHLLDLNRRNLVWHVWKSCMSNFGLVLTGLVRSCVRLLDLYAMLQMTHRKLQMTGSCKWHMMDSSEVLCDMLDSNEKSFFTYNSRVPDQNRVSQACYIVERHHSGRKPSIWHMCLSHTLDVFEILNSYEECPHLFCE